MMRKISQEQVKIPQNTNFYWSVFNSVGHKRAALSKKIKKLSPLVSRRFHGESSNCKMGYKEQNVNVFCINEAVKVSYGDKHKWCVQNCRVCP